MAHDDGGALRLPEVIDNSFHYFEYIPDLMIYLINFVTG